MRIFKQKLLSMESTQWYALIVFGAFVSLAIAQTARETYPFAAKLIGLWFIRLQCTRALNRHRLFGPVTLGTALVWTAMVFCAVISNVVGISNLSDAASRCGTLCLIHLLPLYFTTQLSLAADFFGFTLRQTKFIHHTLGFICSVEAAVHIVFTHRKTSLLSKENIFGIAVSMTELPLQFSPF